MKMLFEIVSLLLVILLLFTCIYFSTIYRKRFEQWKQDELEKNLQLYKKTIDQSIEEIYRNKLEDWKIIEEKRIREDAVKRSHSVLSGHLAEQFAPYSAFEHYNLNPSDARFLGDPIDFVVFKGNSNGMVDGIYFVEVKSGHSTLTKKERNIKEVVEQGLIKWIEIDLH